MKKIDSILTYLFLGLLLLAVAFAVLPSISFLATDLLWAAASLILYYYMLKAGYKMLHGFFRFINLFSNART